MNRPTPKTALRSFLYGAAVMLLVFDLFFLAKALVTSNFIPIVPILAGVFTALGLLLIIYSEHQERSIDRRDARRIARVAHQLEAPLHSLNDDLQSLMREADSLPAEARLKLKHMETRTTVLLANIRDVFLLLRAYEQELSMEVRTYDLCTIMREVIGEVEPLAQARNIELIHTFHCESAAVKLDKQMIKIVLTHLFENALTYTMKPGAVNVAVTKGDGRIRLIFQDRGIGIEEEEMRLVWQPFARGSKAQQFDPDGIGVGLSLSRKIVSEFGGTLSVRNRDTSGVEAVLSLPVVSTKKSENT